MVLYHGDVQQLAGKPWYAVELRSEKTIESTLRRVAKEAPQTFGEHPVEMFVPVAQRDLGVFDLRTSNYIFARSTHFASLLRLKKITGIVGLMTEGDSNRPSQALTVPDSFVQSMIEEAQEEFRRRSSDLNIGSFVRIVDGETRDMCGHVATMAAGMACVVIQAKTKQILVETPTRNLLNLSHVVPELQVWYYSPLVAALEGTGDENLVAPDLAPTEEEFSHLDGLNVEKSQRLGRQQTVTALVKRLIFTGTVKPKEIATQVVAALRAGQLRPPKNLLIVHGIIKGHITRDWAAKQDPTIQSYRDVIARFGSDYRFSVNDIACIDPALGIPYNTGEGDPVGQPRLRKRRVAKA